ncbi:PaaI family thioesterase [Roseovarius autotrophicus]|uniref:PaaI family thioesterase n=1 Tax=Roseovarius autotrophicus TaxID=2824121 RepID=UPI0019F9D5ED|nr:PaaI family thioesterase [Roseovarius autotrophicus]MBE0453271.1 PaaI family thioesterase [Roseovarius sp.]
MPFATSPSDLPDRDAILVRSGLEFIEDMIAGRLPVPPIGRTLGFAPTEAARGRVVFEGAARFEAMNPMGGVHGGWYGAILDSCMGCAVMTELAQGELYTTLEFKVNITRALPLDLSVRATGLVQHRGRSTAVAMGELRGVEDGRVYATGSTTCLVMRPG